MNKQLLLRLIHTLVCAGVDKCHLLFYSFSSYLTTCENAQDCVRVESAFTPLKSNPYDVKYNSCLFLPELQVTAAKSVYNRLNPK